KGSSAMGNQDIPVDLTDRASFSHWTPVTIRFSDQDSLGHVNNVSIAAYVEAGRTRLIHQFLDRGKYPTLNFALVRVEIDYRAEFHYPGTVEIGARLLRIGNKSFKSGYGLFVGDRCVATATSTNVFFDMEKRAAVEPSAEIRAVMKADMAAL